MLGKFQTVFGRHATENDVSDVDADYEYMVSLFGDFIVGESLKLSESEYNSAEIQALHDAAWDKMMSHGYIGAAYFVNGPDYAVRVRLCRKILQTRIELSVQDD